MTWSHGTVSGYASCNGGGRNACDACREANMQRAKEIRQRKRTGQHHPNDQVDPASAIKVVAALRSRGYSDSAIGRLSGVPVSCIHRLARADAKFVTRETSSRLHTALAYADAHPGAGRKDLNVSASQAHQQMRSLAALGWSLSWQRRQLGFSGGVGAFRYGTISRRNAEKVQRLYDQYGGTPGPSKVAARHAQALGWHVPLAYDDDGRLIPGAIPNDLTRAAERREDRQARTAQVERLTRMGLSTAEIAVRLGVTDRTVTRARSRRSA